MTTDTAIPGVGSIAIRKSAYKGHTEAVCGDRARRRPEFVVVLGDDAQFLFPRIQRGDRGIDRGEIPVRSPGIPEQDIRVEEDQSWASSRSR